MTRGHHAAVRLGQCSCQSTCGLMLDVRDQTENHQLSSTVGDKDPHSGPIMRFQV